MSETPELLESVQWNGDNLAEVRRFVNAACTVDEDVLLVQAAGAATAGFVVPLKGRIVRADGELRVLLPLKPTSDAQPTDKSPDVERFADHLAFESGFD